MLLSLEKKISQVPNLGGSEVSGNLDLLQSFSKWCISKQAAVLSAMLEYVTLLFCRTTYKSQLGTEGLEFSACFKRACGLRHNIFFKS